MRIVLTPVDMLLATQVAILRQVTNIRDGRRQRYGAGDDRAWQNHIEGALGEYAVAKAIDRFWNGNLGQFDAADVGRLQVRTSARGECSLIVHRGERDRDVFILVDAARVPIFEIPGWISGIEAKRDEWLRRPNGRPPAYFVPREALRPIETLRR